jgi:Mrp family chromosome partitioning ATPase
MSLIEAAIGRARAIAGTGNATPSARPGQGADRPATERRGQRAPSERIAAVALPIDRALVQENRVLLEDLPGQKGGAGAAYRMLRTRLLRRARTNGWTTIGVTSATPNDGKSLTVLNLGISLAREGNSDVVLLDLDMRNPSMCRYLGVNPPGHLLDYFEHRAPIGEMFFSIGVDNLLLASATVATDRASELLAAPEMESLLQYVKERTANPIILVDLPPVLITDDTLVVAPKVDALLVIAAEGQTNRADLDKALGTLAEFPIAGLVLNRALETGANYGYGYSYGSDTARG